MYIADLHIHSHYSRATSKDCTPEHLDLWAGHKGIGILGTGDFTHPAWREELKEKLIPAEEGLYILKDEYRLDKAKENGGMAPRFVISGEISSIYKKNGKVRKVHSVILLPGLAQAELLSRKLESIGNIHSDGRPILGLDCHDLLEITLELCPDAIYIPAHIWTPHFSLFGAFSGFDTIEECYEDLAPHIHALETGLSSDPPMNWRLSALDRFQLISNSDAHSPAKLGREANLLDIPLSYTGISDAIQKGEGLKGTIEFFPEEGKYHYDGHRKCHLCLAPSEAEKYSGKCPVCGRKLTIGVSHRVEQLADRAEGFVPPDAKPFESLVPLSEVIAASAGCSSASVKVQRQYEAMIQNLGAEFQILRELPLEDIRRASGGLIAEGIRRLREGKVEWNAGYDGEYGTMKLFDRSEIENLGGQLCLFGAGQAGGTEKDKKPDVAEEAETNKTPSAANRKTGKCGAGQNAMPEEIKTLTLNERQQEAVTAVSRAIAVIAGPGTGKTKTLVSRAAYLLNERRVKASEITAVTFTRKAAEEMRSRLQEMAGGKRAVRLMNIGTFHSICHQLLRKQGLSFSLADETELFALAQEVIGRFRLKIGPKQFLRLVSLKKTGLEQKSCELPESSETSQLEEAFAAYEKRLKDEEILDYDDLLTETIRLLKEEKKDEIRKKNFSYLLVDEFQDISPVQYELIQAWNRGGRELFAIGDPDQAIYSFRGADARCFERLAADYPGLRTIRLKENYRSKAPIVTGALAVIEKNKGSERELFPVRGKGKPVRLVTVSGEMAEDIFAAKEINRLIGGIDMLDAQEQAETRDKGKARSFGDIAILYRTHRQGELLEKCLQKEGIPYVVAGREDFLTQESVRGTLCFFTHLVNPGDRVALRLCSKLLRNREGKPIPAEAVTSLKEKYLPMLKKEKPQKLLTSWMEDMNLTGLEPMEKLVGMSLFHKTMPEFLEALAFGGEGDLKRCGAKSYTADAVTLMTLHGSKGLEFPVVMICGIRKGMIPLENGRQDMDLEEERRLFYVGMTRAEDELILITSSDPSPFLADIPEENLLRETTGKQKVRESGKQISFADIL
ncbi:MAG: DNA helicase [Eubacteriales bacterium]|jgi:uncharacterized protein (TIGR00375 family)